MADSTNSVQIIIEAVDKATAVVQKAVGGISGSLSSLMNDAKLASAEVAGALSLVGKSVIDVAADFEKAGVMTRFLTANEAEASKFSQSLINLALKSSFTTKEITTLGARMIGQVKDVDTSVKGMDALTNAVSATGGGILELENAQRALTQTFIKGVPSLEELNKQFNNANIPVMRTLAEALSSGAVQLKGYTDAVVTSGGASKAQVNAFQSASEKLPILTKGYQAAEARLKALKDKGVDPASKSFLNAEKSVMSTRLALDKAQGSINTYNSALGSTTSTTAFHKSTEEIMADLQKVSKLGLTGKDTAIAIMDALVWKYKGANEAMLNTFWGLTRNIVDQIQVMSSSILGIDKNLNVREGSIFYYLKQGAKGLSDFLMAHRYDVANFVDSLLKNKDALIAIATIITVLLLPALIWLLGPWIAMAKLMVILAPAFFLVGKAMMYFIDQAGGIDKVKTSFVNFAQSVYSTTTEIASALISAFKKIEPVLSKVFKFLVENLDYVIGAIAGVVAIILVTLVPAFLAQAAAAGAAAIATMAALAPIIILGAIFGILAVMIIKNWDQITAAYEIGRDLIVNAMSTIIDFFLITVPTAFNNLLISIGNFINSTVTFFAELPQKIVTAIYNFFVVDLPTMFGFALGLWLVALPNFEVRVINEFIKLGTNIITEVSTWPGRFLTWITNLIINVLGAIAKFGFDLWSNIILAGTNVTNEVSTWPTKIMNWLNTIPGKIAEMLVNLKQAFIDGLQNAWNVIIGWKDKIIKVFDDIKGAIGNALGKAAEATKLGYVKGTVAFQHGGIVPGAIGAPVPILAHGGERIVSRTGVDTNLGGGSGMSLTINLNGDVTLDNEDRVNQLANQIIRTLGRQNELSRYGMF
ncbi:MAG: tape measure protein [Actinomycetota bacterium]